MERMKSRDIVWMNWSIRCSDGRVNAEGKAGSLSLDVVPRKEYRRAEHRGFHETMLDALGGHFDVDAVRRGADAR